MRRLLARLLGGAVVAGCLLFSCSGMSWAKVTAEAEPLPDLVVSALTAPATALPGTSFGVTETTKNQGTAGCGASSTRICLARDEALTDLVTQKSLTHTALAADASEQKGGPLAVPADLAVGTYYVGAIADINGQVAESDENNNKRSQTIFIGDAPDLVVSSLTAPGAALPGDTLSVAETTKNQGTAGCGPSSTRICLARDQALTDQVTNQNLTHSGLAAGASQEKTGTLTVPVSLPLGTYYIGAIADISSQVTESNENNNKYSQTLLLGESPDLAVSSLTAPAGASPGQSINVSETTKNQGTAACGVSSTRICLARDQALTDRVTSQDLAHSALEAGASEQKFSSLAIPPTLPLGTYYVGAIADVNGQVVESGENNNKRSQTINIADMPDLVVSSLTAPGSALPGSSIVIGETTQNQGTADAGASSTRICLARDEALTDLIASRDLPHAALGGGASEQKTGPVNAPAGLAAGTYYVGAIADIKGQVAESNEDNNKRSQTIFIGSAPDLVVSSLTAPASALPEVSIGVSETTSNQGTGGSGASSTRICLARDEALTDQIASNDLAHGALGAGVSEGKGGPLVAPAGLPVGIYYVGAIADINGQVAESHEDNNKRSQTIFIGAAPDLVVSALSAPSNGFPGQSITVTETTKNQGTGGSGASSTRICLARDEALTDQVNYQNLAHAALGPGASEQKGGALVVPASLPVGTYYVGAIADINGQAAEIDENNNKRSQTISILIPSRWIAIWYFDEGSGGTASDSSNRGNEGSLLPQPPQGTGPTWTSERAPGKTAGFALSFDGSDDRVEATDIDLPDKILVRAWVRPAASTWEPQAIVSKWNPGCAGNYELGLTADLKPFFSVGVGSGECGTAYTLTSGTKLPAGEWHHLAGTRDGSQIVLYVDGKPPVAWAITGSVLRNNLLTTIGRSAAQGTEATLRHFQGVIDEVFLANWVGSFSDIYPTHWAFDQIEACASSGIVQGYEDGTYQPTWPVTRALMAVYISRALAGGDGNVPPGPGVASFVDVPTGHWAFKYVEYAVSQGVVKGYDATHYQPDWNVDRAQMAVYVSRALAGGDGNVPPGPAVASFVDVPTGYWAFKYVEYAVSQGVVQGYDATHYQPTWIVDRGQMAVYVARGFDLTI